MISLLPARPAVLALSLLTALLLTVPATAQAQTPDCGTLNLDIVNRYFLDYTTAETATDDPERVTIDYLPGTPVRPFQACNLAATFDGNTLEIKAKTLADLRRPLAQERTFLYIPQRRGGYQNFFQLDLNTRTIAETFHLQVSGDAQTVVSVRVDDGPLQPLMRQGQLFSVTYPETARMVNIYATNPTSKIIGVARVQLDLPNATLTIWYKAELPKP